MTTWDLFHRFGRLRALVVGDICLDRWCTYDPALSEPSRETGLDRIAVISEEQTPGGGGTVANNLAAMGLARVAVLGCEVTQLHDRSGGLPAHRFHSSKPDSIVAADPNRRAAARASPSVRRDLCGRPGGDGRWRRDHRAGAAGRRRNCAGMSRNNSLGGFAHARGAVPECYRQDQSIRGGRPYGQNIETSELGSMMDVPHARHQNWLSC